MSPGLVTKESTARAIALATPARTAHRASAPRDCSALEQTEAVLHERADGR